MMTRLILVTVTALVAGVMNAVAGGGTFLTFPALTWYGLDQKVANMTSTIGLWPGSASSVAAAGKDFARIPRGMLITFSIISLLGGFAGSTVILRTTSERSFELVIPWLLAFATVIFGFSKPISRWAGRHHGNRSLGWTIIVGFVQIFVAIYGGYFGAGIGVLMLAGLSFAGLDDIHQMNALKVLLATLINGVAAIVFLFNPHINWPVAGAMAIASVLGGFWGMAVARRVKPDTLRAVILLIGVSLTGVYFAKNYFHAF